MDFGYPRSVAPRCWLVYERGGGHNTFGIGAPELIVILVIALVVFGPSKLPEVGSALGKGIRDFKKSFEGKEEDDAKKTIEIKPEPPSDKGTQAS